MPADSVPQNKDDKSMENLEIQDNKSETPPDSVVTEKIDDTPTTSTAQHQENNVESETEWQKPISLKALKKKLNEIFVVKYV